jgi:hydrogenase maturation protease
MAKTAIMGFGNPVRSDDVVGVYVIEQLKKELQNNVEVSLLDMGTSAFEVLFQLKGHQRIIIVDSVINSNEPVGTLFKLPASEIEGAIEDNPLVFLHSLKWNQGLSYAKKILKEEYPSDIQVYLIAIENIKLEIQISEEVKNAGNKVVNLIKLDIQNL